MPYHYEATSEFMQSVSEVEKLTILASSNDENRTLFLKLAVVSLVTKFQVFVEKALNEYIGREEQNATYIKLFESCK